MSKANTRVIDLPEQTQPTGEEVTYIATENEDLKISLAGIRNFNAKIFSQKSANLSDLENKEASRINLGVYSREQIDTNNTARDKKISDIEAINTSQNAEIEGIKNKNTEQDTRLESIENLNASQNVEIEKIKDVNIVQSEKIGQLETKSTEISGKVTRIETELAEKIDASEVENNYANKTHNHTTSEISDYNTETYNIIKNKIIAGQNVTITEEDEKLKITATGGGNGGGGGDMLKSIYDKDNDGKVDVAKIAESVDWNNVTGKPATFPVATHTHAIENITGLQTELNKKSPIGHLHPISEITGLQNALNDKADATHNHEISEVFGLSSKITELTLNINRKADKTTENTFTEKQTFNKGLTTYSGDNSDNWIHIWRDGNLNRIDSFNNNDNKFKDLTFRGDVFTFLSERRGFGMQEAFKIGERIPDGSDLNNFKTPGFYFCETTYSSRTMTNIPLPVDKMQAFGMCVYEASGVIQEITLYRTQYNRKFIRTFYWNSWSDWQSIPISSTYGVWEDVQYPGFTTNTGIYFQNGVRTDDNRNYWIEKIGPGYHARRVSVSEFGLGINTGHSGNLANYNHPSIAIGDSDTGFRWEHDGKINLYSNNIPVATLEMGGLFSNVGQHGAGHALTRKDYVDGNFKKIVWKSESLNGTGNIWLHHGLNITEQEFFEGKYDFIAYFQSGTDRKVIDGSYDDTSGGNKWLRWSGDVGAYVANTMVVGVNHLYINNGNLGTLRRVIIYKNY